MANQYASWWIDLYVRPVHFLHDPAAADLSRLLVVDPGRLVDKGSIRDERPSDWRYFPPSGMIFRSRSALKLRELDDTVLSFEGRGQAALRSVMTADDELVTTCDETVGVARPTNRRSLLGVGWRVLVPARITYVAIADVVL